MDFNKIRKAAGKNFEQARFFASSRVHRYLLTRINRIGDLFRVPKTQLSLWYKEDDSVTAYTDNRSISINAGHELFRGDSDSERLSLLLGVSLHEESHRIFTNNMETLRLLNQLREGKGLSPAPSGMDAALSENFEKLQKHLEEKAKASVFADVFKSLLNSLEDARIERMAFQYVTGHANVKEGLFLLRHRMADLAEDVAEADAKVELGIMPTFLAMQNSILHYARWDEVKGDKTGSDIAVRLDDIGQYITAYRETDNTLSAFDNLKLICATLLPEIEEFFEMAEDMANQSQDGDGETGEGEGEPTEGNGTGNGSRDLSDLSEEELREIANKLKEMVEKAKSDNPLSEENGADESSKGSERNSVKKAIKEAKAQIGFETGEEREEDALKHAEGPEDARIVSADNLRATGTGAKTFENISASPIDAELSKLKEAFIKDEADNIAEDRLKDEYDNIIRNTDFGSAHKGTDLHLMRVNEGWSRLETILYDVEKETFPISKAMARKSDFFEKDRDDIIVKGLYSGSKFEAGRVARPDYKYFSKKKAFDEPLSLAISLVVDESGSMHGTKEEAARAFSLIIYDYVQLLKERCGVDIALNIIGHTTGSGTTCFLYTDSEKPDPKDRLRLMDIKARASNRDGHAIRLALARLEEQNALQKLLFVVTDGQPAAPGYGGKTAEADLRDVANHCDKEGIGLLVAAIDSDKERIKQIYGGDHFVDIKHLDSLAGRILRVVKNLLAA